MNLVIVESPAKSKTLSKYLGKDYKILASFGHIRDLPSKNGSVNPDNNFEMLYEVKTSSKRHINEILSSAKNAKTIYIASDPDREGEAIAWNVKEILVQKKIKAEIKRSVFNEITKDAVINAIKNPREIDEYLVEAQQSRLCLDYLVGFFLSPVLWKKLPNSKSAGRVQSVALRLIVERETEIRSFIPSEYWSVFFNISSKNKEIFETKVVEYKGKKISNSFPKDEKTAQEIVQKCEDSEVFTVKEIESKDTKRNPFAPFNTSSLQQDASNKLGFSVDRTMKVAQKLYEGIDIGSKTQGLITYMRTDGTNLSNEAIKNIRDFVLQNYGKDYISPKAIIYKTKTKNAQEAHEAIRPIDANLIPEDIKKYLSDDEFKLYSLIWKRAVACQMSSGIFLRQSVTLVDKTGDVITKSNGSSMKFDGFLKVYQVSFDDAENLLPNLKEGDEVNVEKPVSKKQHFTQPKPRYTEASLVAQMEELGIGRPSTYASIINILQTRGYAEITKRQFHPNLNGVLVVNFLKLFFTEYVDYKFTANLEEELDIVSNGDIKKLDFLTKFWGKFYNNVNETMAVALSESGPKIAKSMDEYIFCGEFAKSRKCLKCGGDDIELAIGKFGLYTNCNSCAAKTSAEKYLDPNAKDIETFISNSASDGYIGDDSSGNKIYQKSGRFGDYFELIDGKTGEMLKRSTIPQSYPDKTVENAIFLLSMPREIGKIEGEDAKIGIGKFGPYIFYKKRYISLGDIDIDSIDTTKAAEIIANPPKRTSRNGSSSAPREKKTKEIGIHPKTKKTISVGKSKFGVYALYQKKFYTIQDVNEVEDVTLDMCVDAIGG